MALGTLQMHAMVLAAHGMVLVMPVRRVLETALVQLTVAQMLLVVASVAEVALVVVVEDAADLAEQTEEALDKQTALAVARRAVLAKRREMALEAVLAAPVVDLIKTVEMVLVEIRRVPVS